MKSVNWNFHSGYGKTYHYQTIPNGTNNYLYYSNIGLVEEFSKKKHYFFQLNSVSKVKNYELLMPKHSCLYLAHLGVLGRIVSMILVGQTFLIYSNLNATVLLS